MYDVIVAGARCAGASTAMLLARQGHRVLLVDRSRFPSDIPHGHLIHRHGPRRLHGWGLLDRVVGTHCPPITTLVMDRGAVSVAGQDLVVDGVAVAYGPRRAALDHVLVQAAVEAGAELREGFAVQEFTASEGRITGIRGRDRAGGALVAEQATVVVGADGRNSRLAATVQAAVYEAVPPLTCWYFSYWSDVPACGLEIHARPQHVVFAFPTNDDLFALFVAWPAARLPAVRADLEGEYMAAVDQIPELAGRVRGGRRVERIYGATDLPNFYRRPYGPGWALVGDAGCHKDPYLALGVCDAFRDAELLAEALDAGLAGRQPLDAALAEYEQRRNAASSADYQQNLRDAQFQPPPPEQVRLMAALQGNQAQINRFLMANEGMIPREAFFNPDNLAALMQPRA
jgi:flavin-dependent dehydrogenase